MRARLLVFLGLLSISWHLPAAPAQARNLRLTLVGARLDPARVAAGGYTRSTAPLSDLSCLALPVLRSIAGACGGRSLASMGGPQRPVDPFLRLEIGDRVIRTYPVPGSLTPRWDYQVILDEEFLKRSAAATLALYDYLGPEPGKERRLGAARLPLKDLLRPGLHKLPDLGGAEVSYQVERLDPQAAPRRYAFRIPATQEMAELARQAGIGSGGGSGYVLIPVAEGEVVEVTATGQVRPNAKKHPERVAGPDGIPTIQTKIQYNEPGFRECPGCNHAALIAQVGIGRLVIGRHKVFTSAHSGYLVLGINDLKASDNDGGFDVQVTVSVPAPTHSMFMPSRRRGGREDAGPAAIDPRVVQQTVDSHGEEMDACVSSERDPYGEVVLIFSISSDGSPLGVLVERCSPNLQRAGECMRRKALRWRFPAPRAAVTARYLISFTPS